MRVNFTVLVALAGILFLTPLAHAQGENHEELQHEQAYHEGEHSADSHGEESGEKDIKGIIKETIQHHLADSYEFHITDGLGFPLPVILVDGGLKVFMSSAFHHGGVASVAGNHYIVNHGKIYKTDAAGTITYDDRSLMRRASSSFFNAFSAMPFNISSSMACWPYCWNCALTMSTVWSTNSS